MDETDRVEVERIDGFTNYVNTSKLVWTFSDWLHMMEQLQQVAYGQYYDNMDPETKAHSMLMNLYAVEDELHEMGSEMGWKPWASPQGWINREAVISEAVDLMHFLANLLKHANCTGVELTEAYKKKMLKNLQRQIDGYDAVSNKCRQCHRDLTEVELTAIYESMFNGVLYRFCNIGHFRKYCGENAKEILSDPVQP